MELRCKHLAAGRERKSFCTVTETIDRDERQPPEWENISTHRRSNKHGKNAYDSALSALEKPLTTKWAEGLNVFPKTYRWARVESHRKRCSTSLITRESKATIKHHFIPVRLVIIKTKNRHQ